MRRFLLAAMLVGIVAVVTHVATVVTTPHILMSLVMGGVALESNSNTMVHPPRPDAQNQRIVRSSPDLAYSICSVDVSDGPVEVSIPTAGTYASVAVYARSSDNIFSVNDRDALGSEIRVTIALEEDSSADLGTDDYILIEEPKALVLVRRVIQDDAHYEEIRQLQNRERCDLLATRPETLSGAGGQVASAGPSSTSSRFGWIWLVLAMAWLWSAFNALVPTHWPGTVAIASWISGWTTSELAPGYVMSQLSLSALFAFRGGLETGSGRIAATLTVCSIALLIVVHQHARRTARTCADALDAEMDVGWSRDLNGARGGVGTPGIDIESLLRPLPLRARRVDVLKNIAYHVDSECTLRLDVYRHPSRPKDAPVLLQIHGGAWKYGSKSNQGVPLMTRLSRSGWICVAIEYRLAPVATLHEMVVDAKRALSWIRSHIAEYGGDPDFVAVSGGSAGGHLAAMLASTQNDPRFQPGFEEVDTSIQACVPLYPILDLVDESGCQQNGGLQKLLEQSVIRTKLEEDRASWEALSPLHVAKEDMPPTMILHGDRDTVAPAGASRFFVETARRMSRNPVVYVELVGAHHAFDVIPSVRSLEATASIHKFLAWSVSAHDGARLEIAA